MIIVTTLNLGGSVPATEYKIWAFGDYVGEGATQSVHVGIAAVAKCATNDSPLIVANELICNHLARAILLPCPPGFVIRKEEKPYFVSLDFNLAGQSLPPVDAAKIIEKYEELAWGIILFDIWVVNPDRHKKNISFNTLSGKIQIYDHSHAFMGASKDPKQQIETNKDSLGIGRHCLAREVTCIDFAKKWADKIQAVPEFYIREVLASAKEVNLPDEVENFCVDNLLKRRKNLLTLIENNKGTFPKLHISLV